MTTQNKPICRICGASIHRNETQGERWWHIEDVNPGHAAELASPTRLNPVSTVSIKSPVLNEWLTQDDVKRLRHEFYKAYPDMVIGISDFDLFAAWMYKRGRLDERGEK